jgi:hypothetical protein
MDHISRVGRPVLRYPAIGSILVSKSGSTLVYVWPNESDKPACFTGVSLLSGDVSSLWLIGNFERCNLFKRELVAKYRIARRLEVSA